MNPHKFLFQPGQWIGQGKISFSHAAGHVRFYTKWIVKPSIEGCIYAEQQIEQEGEPERLFNAFVITHVTDIAFEIHLSNELAGKVQGHGVINAKTIGWEFRRSQKAPREEVEGLEVYELQENGDYMLHAEYCSDTYRTVIDGRIWQKAL